MQNSTSQKSSIFDFITQQKQYKSFRIINKRTKQCLTEGPQVLCRPLSKTNVKQLWTFQKIKDQFGAIISFSSGLGLTKNNNGQNINCQKFKSKQHQLWDIQFCYENKLLNQKYYWIVPKNNIEECLFATVNSSNTILLKFDRTLFTSLWVIEEVDQNDRNFGFCQIRSILNNLVLEAQDSLVKQDGLIIQAKQQGKGTQKWIIEKLFNHFIIRNLCSGFVLSVGEQVKQNFQVLNILGKNPKNCRKINQQIFQNSNNQKWNLIKISQNQFYLQCEDDHDKFLGTLSTKQKVPVYLLHHQYFGEQMKNILWKIRGALPDSAAKQKFLDIKLDHKKQ